MTLVAHQHFSKTKSMKSEHCDPIREWWNDRKEITRKGLDNMEKSALTNITENLTQPEKNFVSDLKHLAGEARRQAYRSADHLLVVRNWLIGWRIVTQEQNGKERAKYGKHVIQLASQTLTEEYGRGFGLTSIKNMRSFYLMFSNLQIGQAMLDQF